jgi:lysophospholipase L1-like esterase
MDLARAGCLVCLGDSGTFGIWRGGPKRLAFDNYPDVLRELLAAEGEPWEVWNGGVLGYGSSTALRFFESEVVDLEPDVVSLRVGFNDHSVSSQPERVIHEPEPGWLRVLFYAVRDLKILHLGIVAHGRRTAQREKGTFTLVWVPLDRFRRDLERFAEVAREREIRLLLLDYPIRALERGLSPDERLPFMAPSLEHVHAVHERYQRTLREVASAEGMELVETAPRMAAAPRESFSDYDLAHPNRMGARIIAEALFEQLAPSDAAEASSVGRSQTSDAR